MHNHGDNISTRQLWKHIKGIPTFCFRFVPSDNIKAEALSTESSNQRFTYDIMKEIQVHRSGKIRVSFDYYNDTAFGSVATLKGGAVVTEYTAPAVTPATWHTATEDIDVSAGDLIQLGIKSFNSESHSVRNFRLKWDTIRSEEAIAWS